MDLAHTYTSKSFGIRKGFRITTFTPIQKENKRRRRRKNNLNLELCKIRFNVGTDFFEIKIIAWYTKYQNIDRGNRMGKII